MNSPSVWSRVGLARLDSQKRASASHLWLVAALLTLGASVTAAAAPDEAGVRFFETEVRPLLVEHCYSCHSDQAERLRGGLRLDSKEGWLLGGDLGPAIEPDDPEASLLLQAVSYEDEFLQMPPQGKLGQDDIALLNRWVAMGAPAPLDDASALIRREETINLEQAREFWAFQPPEDPTVPEVLDSTWASSDLDRFILAELEANGLTPAPRTDKRTLIRRATFDLTGLPPTPEEIQAFLEDDTADAFARVVDRLLASPHYGERWGRHWLDVARYADSNGLDENIAHGNAWRYRDYVVSSFNSDKPYDQFVNEQLAGDLLPPTDSIDERNARLIATGFLALGPKVLAEVDAKKMEMDIVDEQIDTVGRVFLGLTIGCARCHDHKFDPISTADYYGLAGVFMSTRTMESFKIIAKWHENSLANAAELAQQAAHEQEVASKKEEIESLISKANERLQADGGDEFQLPESPEELYPEPTKDELNRLRDELKALEDSAPELPMAMGVTEGTVTNTNIHIRGNHLSLGEEVPRRVPQVLAARTSSPTFSEGQSGRLELAQWLIEKDHPLTSRVMVNRIWRWHFGQGLVSSTENFGLLGDQPSHPPLLDWLAHRFIESGWSIKKMHRLIMLSNMYQMSSLDNAEAARIDPENRLYWRISPRRLEAEAIRDALLAVSSRLDRSMGGSLLHVKNREFFFDHTSRDTTKYESVRRSIYLPVVRNHLYDMFLLFDSTDASVATSDRATTTVAPQALFLMNSELVLQAAQDLAGALLDRGDLDDAGRIERLYESAYGRHPSAAESSRATSFLEQSLRVLCDESEATPDESARLEAWQALCQVILTSNEFVYIR